MDLSFWEALHQIKLDKQKLESPFVNITGTLKPAGDRAGFGGSISVDGTSFDSHDPGRR